MRGYAIGFARVYQCRNRKHFTNQFPHRKSSRCGGVAEIERQKSSSRRPKIQLHSIRLVWQRSQCPQALVILKRLKIEQF